MAEQYRSPLLQLPGAIPGSGPDSGLPWHFGDPLGEQRATERGALLVDRSDRVALAIGGEDRLGWLHTITSQHLTQAPAGIATEALVLDAQGRVEHHMTVSVLDETVVLVTDADRAETLRRYLEQMIFWSKVSVDQLDLAQLDVLGLVDGLIESLPEVGQVVSDGEGFVRRDAHSVSLLVPRAELVDAALRLRGSGVRLGGSWAQEALRIAARIPRIGQDTDDRTIPNELGWLHTAVHLDKGCYRGQETVARVHNLGRPPRRLALLHLDGSADSLPGPGDELLTDAGRVVGRVGSAAQHYELGPIALALVKSTVPAGTQLLAGGVDAVIDPADEALPAGPPTSAIDRRAFTDLRRR